jgi:hypothetical protein
VPDSGKRQLQKSDNFPGGRMNKRDRNNKNSACGGHGQRV